MTLITKFSSKIVLLYYPFCSCDSYKHWILHTEYPANITFFQRYLLVDMMSRREAMSRQRWNYVVYFNLWIYSVEQRRVNVVYFNIDINNVRKPQNNIFNVELHNVGKRGSNIVEMTISK